MKIDHVPQDNVATYANEKKVIYATQENGHYTLVASSGWSIEEEATRQALDELKRLKDDAYEKVERGDASPLLYHMYAQRMDVQILAQTTSIFQWRIKRHFDPKIYAKLNDTFLQRYSEALGVDIEALRFLPTRECDV